MPGADDLMMRIYAAMAQKEHALISERTRAALATAKARGAVLGGDRGYRPSVAPCAAAAANARVGEADRTAHRVRLETERLQRGRVTTLVELARELTALRVPTPRPGCAWTHTTVERVIGRAEAVAELELPGVEEMVLGCELIEQERWTTSYAAALLAQC